MLEITTKIDLTVKKYNMLNQNDFVVAGVSGGADSMLLLHYLIQKRDELNLKLLVANVEHGIRGNESIRDSEFVKSFCKKNNVDFVCKSINAVDEAKANSLSVEEYSRNVRYEFFNSFGADKIATAHNLSDNAETVLFRLSRGTSLKGCCGIPPVRDNIIRPLIDVSSDDIRQYCCDMGIDYVVDSTNDCDDYSRNFIRHYIVKDFEQLNPSFEQTFSRFIASVNEDDELLNLLADNAYEKSLVDNKLDLIALKKNHISIIKRVIFKYFDSNGVALDELHLNLICNLLDKTGKEQIKGSIFAVSNAQYLRIANFDSADKSINVETKIIDYNSFLNNCELFKKEIAFYCDYDKIVGNIFVRPRIEGDTISPANRGVTKSLKKLFNEYAIPVENRGNVPVACDDNGVIGVCGYCCDERVKVEDKTKNVLLLYIRMEDL